MQPCHRFKLGTARHGRSSEGGRWRPEERKKASFLASLREMGEGMSIRGERRSLGKKKEGRSWPTLRS